MALDYGWGSRFGQDKWHVIKIDEEGNDSTVGVAVCGDGVLSRESGDSIDYGGHPRIGTRCEKCEESRIDGWLDWLDADRKDKESENETQALEAAGVSAISIESEQTRKEAFYFSVDRTKDFDKYFSQPQLSAAEFKCTLADQIAVISFRCPKRGNLEEFVPIGYFCIVTFKDDGAITLECKRTMKFDVSASIEEVKEIQTEGNERKPFHWAKVEIQTRKKMFYFIATRRNKDIDKYFNSHQQLIDAKFKCVLTGDNVALFSFRCPKLGPQEEIVPIGYFCIITIREDGSICVGTTPQIPDELVDLMKIGGECADTAFTLRP